jgi:hypothetical protein
MSDYFRKVKTPSVSVAKYYTPERIAKLDWHDLPGYQVNEIPRQVLLNESFFQDLDNKFGLAGAGLLKWPSMISYFWHEDGDRNATINMQISYDGHSHTLFGNKKSDWHMDIEELVYEPGYFYLFNTQQPHEMINLGTDRYLFTTRITADPTYEELLEWAVANGWAD